MKLYTSTIAATIGKYFIFCCLAIFSLPSALFAQEAAKEEDFFKINKVRSPEGTLLEVGGLCTLPNGDLAVTTRRGDIFIHSCPVKICNKIAVPFTGQEFYRKKKVYKKWR